MPPSVTVIVTCCVLLALSALVNARPEFRARLPNALATADEGLTCAQLGHESCVPGKLTVDQFGKDFKAAGYEYTAEFCAMDSDGDGVSNGAELGDPCCIWKAGDTIPPTRFNDLSDPSDPDSVPKEDASKVCPPDGGAPAAPADGEETETEDKGVVVVDPEATPVSGAVVPEAEDAVAEPEESPVASPEPIDCFAGDATVLLKSGARKKMADLAVGDHVQVGANQYSEVFMFTHRIHDTVCDRFVRLSTAAHGSIVLTKGHYIRVANKGLVRADHVSVGDLLTTHQGTLSPVTNIENDLRKIGLYNPQTKHGDIVVDGFQASTYTDACEAHIAHALLAPLRALHPVVDRLLASPWVQPISSQ